MIIIIRDVTFYYFGRLLLSNYILQSITTSFAILLIIILSIIRLRFLLLLSLWFP